MKALVLGSLLLSRRFGQVLALTAGIVFANAGQAQNLVAQQGDALRVDILEQARNLSMRDVYSRSLYSHIRANPSVFQNPNFYVGFLIYLLQQDPNFRCEEAFSSEFERRDYFTQAFNLQASLAEVIASVPIPERFDSSYVIDTGRYDFATQMLPLEKRQLMNATQELQHSVYASSAKRPGYRDADRCAKKILEGTNVDSDQFAWSFSILNEAGVNQQPDFPFEASLQLPDGDARQLFQRFGRQLYAIVSYQVRAATDGSRKIQVIPTDGQLFGLSSDAVVRVRTYAHPTLSQPNYLDVSNLLQLDLKQLRTEMRMSFQQEGFRAVGTGVRVGNGTDFSAAVEMPVAGSGAVGNSDFILRLSSPQMLSQSTNLREFGLRDSEAGSERYLTIFGSVDFEGVTQTSAPVSGQVVIHQINPQTGVLEASDPIGFQGEFLAPGSESSLAEEPAGPASSQLDELVVPQATAKPAATHGGSVSVAVEPDQ